MARRKVKRKYEVPPGTYRVEWDWAQEPPTEEPPMESSVEFEYKGGTWFDFDDKWMDVFVEHAKPKVTQDREILGEMHHFAAETKLGKDSCCCGATKENPCECMIQGIMQCSATCPCSLEKKDADTIQIRTMTEAPPLPPEVEKKLEELAQRINTLLEQRKFEEAEKVQDELYELAERAYKEAGGAPELIMEETLDVDFGAEEAEDYGVQPTWMAETEGPSASQSSLDSTNLTHWANANDSDDIKYLIGGFIGGVLATAVGAIAGEWAVQRMKKHGKLI